MPSLQGLARVAPLQRLMRAVPFRRAFGWRAQGEQEPYEGKPPRKSARRCEEAVQVGQRNLAESRICYSFTD